MVTGADVDGGTAMLTDGIPTEPRPSDQRDQNYSNICAIFADT
jgi:hypothetical protein